MITLKRNNNWPKSIRLIGTIISHSFQETWLRSIEQASELNWKMTFKATWITRRDPSIQDSQIWQTPLMPPAEKVFIRLAQLRAIGQGLWNSYLIQSMSNLKITSGCSRTPIPWRVPPSKKPWGDMRTTWKKKIPTRESISRTISTKLNSTRPRWTARRKPKSTSKTNLGKRSQSKWNWT